MATTRPRAKGEPFAVQFGARLRETRDTRGMTQAQLAEAIGAYPSQISHYENGDKVPEGETMVALAGALDVSLDWLARGVASNAPDEVRDARLRQSIRDLEALRDRRLVNVVVVVVDALVAQEHHAAVQERVSKRRKR